MSLRRVAREAWALAHGYERLFAMAGVVLAAAAAVGAFASNLPAVAQVAILVGVALVLGGVVSWAGHIALGAEAGLEVGHGLPYDDPRFGTPGPVGQPPSVVELLESLNMPTGAPPTPVDPHAFAKKLRVVATRRNALERCQVRVGPEVPGGPFTLVWFPNGEEERTVRPGVDTNYVLLPTGLLDPGEHRLTIEVEHERIVSGPERYLLDVRVPRRDFPEVTITRVP